MHADSMIAQKVVIQALATGAAALASAKRPGQSSAVACGLGRC